MYTLTYVIAAKRYIVVNHFPDSQAPFPTMKSTKDKTFEWLKRNARIAANTRQTVLTYEFAQRAK